MDNIDRRKFIGMCVKGGTTLILPSLFVCNNNPKNNSEDNLTKFKKKSKKELEIELLNDFLEPSEAYLNKKEITDTLYEIQIACEFGRETVSRATYLGDNLFITSYHVVDEDLEDRVLIPQRKRNYGLNFQRKFKVVEYDPISDLALLKTTEADNKGKAKLHLNNIIPSLDDRVSSFSWLTGKTSKEPFEVKCDGKDLYDQTKIIRNLGKLILPANSHLFESEGKVLKYNEEYMEKNYYQKGFKSRPENNIITSINGDHGSSGQPVFLKKDKDKYQFIGITKGGFTLDYYTPVSNHPLGESEIVQTIAFVVHRSPIEKLAKGYIKRISRYL